MKVVTLVLSTLAGLVAVLVIGLLIAAAWGGHRMEKAYNLEAEALIREAAALPPMPLKDPASLPAPVRRYLKVLSPSGGPHFKSVILSQTGEIIADPRKRALRLTAEQVYSLNPVGFVWLARAPALPFLNMWARDQFIGGRGGMLVKFLGLVTVTDSTGPELDQGDGLRALSEMLVFPDFVRSPALTWSAVDLKHARVRMVLGGLNLEGLVGFNEAGEMQSFETRRYRSIPGGYELVPWTGLSLDWKDFGNGLRLPSRWEAVWKLKEGDLTYIRLNVTGAKVQ